MNKPQIRFKGFDEEWEENFLKELFLFQYGKYNNNPSNGGKYPVFGANGVIGKFSEYNAEDSIIIGHMGEYAGSVLWGEGKHFVTYNGTITKPKDKEYSSQYAYYLLYSLNISKICAGSGLPFLAYNTLNQIYCATAKDKKEQTKIANFFKNIDKLISQEEKKYTKLTNLKKAMLEKMFPRKGERVPQIRFKGFSGEWEENNLDSVVSFYSGLTYSPNNIVKSDGTLVLRSSNVKKGQISTIDNVYVNSAVVNSKNVEIDDIIVVVRNGSRDLIGKHAQVQNHMKNTVIGAFMTGISTLNSSFINSLLDTRLFTLEVEKNLGATINQITTGAFKQMTFKFPQSSEQTKIGNFFKTLDKRISLQQKKIDKLKNMKKALLDKMFV